MVETRTARNRTAWFGWVTFAAVMLVVLGLLNVLEGLVALLQNQVTFIDGDSLVIVDLTGLGIVMVVFGSLLIAAGIGLLARNTAARIVAIVVVALHALTQVGSLGAYPVWSLLMITLDVIILFALTVHWVEPPVETAGVPPLGGTHRAERDLQTQGGLRGFPVNPPATPARGTPAHAASDMPGQQAPGPQQAPGSPHMPGSPQSQGAHGQGVQQGQGTQQGGQQGLGAQQGHGAQQGPGSTPAGAPQSGPVPSGPPSSGPSGQYPSGQFQSGQQVSGPYSSSPYSSGPYSSDQYSDQYSNQYSPGPYTPGAHAADQQQSPYQQQSGPNAGPRPGPYPPGRPGSPAHAAPTSGHGTGAI